MRPLLSLNWKILFGIVALSCCLSLAPQPGYASILTHTLNGVHLDISWTSDIKAAGYKLYYAPFPYTGSETIASFDMGMQTSASFDLWEGASYYMAVSPVYKMREGDMSNIELFSIPVTAPIVICTDADGDGYSVEGGDCGVVDCNDSNGGINPGVDEVYDGVDNNCNGSIDEGFVLSTWYADEDGDGYGNSDINLEDVTQPTGYVTDNTDCNDTVAGIHPGADEVYDGVDNNCDGSIDEGFTPTTWYADEDGDGYGNFDISLEDVTQPTGYVTDNTDCNDTDYDIHPGATDIPDDGIDQDCDGPDATEVVITPRPLNDTGIINFADDVSNGLTREPVEYPGQDASLGRDAAAIHETLEKIGSGSAGFDFTKIAGDGSDLENQYADYSYSPWVAVKDNHTGLMWEVKTDDEGLRFKDWTYTWYNSTGINDGGSAGTANGGSCYDDSNCDTEKYVAAVNADGLAGYHDWRLPTIEELYSIADYGTYDPVINIDYFPNTYPVNFWSASPFAANSENAWFFVFNFGGNRDYVKSSSEHVRLVRDVQ